MMVEEPETGAKLWPMLIIFGGLPGVGKTAIARELAPHIGAAHLRIDSVEQAILASGVVSLPLHDTGYRVACAVAADNLRMNRGAERQPTAKCAAGAMAQQRPTARSQSLKDQVAQTARARGKIWPLILEAVTRSGGRSRISLVP